ncbi:MAG: DUF3160 domain-containing protein [Armatimonadota bacterium]
MRKLVLTLFLTLNMATWGQQFGNLTYTPKPVEAKVPAYTVKADLGNVENRKILPKLTDEQRKALAANGFVARPTADEQLFYIYENNAYKKIGSFVTTDSVLHTYHIFYDFTLRYLEKERLFPTAKQISRLMLDANLRELKSKTAHPANIRIALTRNAVYFAVPLTLLGEKPKLPADIGTLVKAELTRIEAHKGRDNCITGAEIDYSQFIPRGHYTRTPEFKRYFKAMMWYGLTPMNLEKMVEGKPVLDTRATLEALIITDQLGSSAKARELWQQLYDPTVFYVGKADDLSYYQYATLSAKVFGKGGIDRFDNSAKLEQFRDAVKKELPGPGIENYTAEQGTQGKQFRFMGQRFIPDSRILQELTVPKVQERYFPMGLDVFAVLGNPRAAQILDETLKQTRYGNYLEQRKKMQDEVKALTAREWQQNLYYGWMYCLLPLQEPKPAGYPSFMRNTAWQDKSLLTSLGSWTELRHDTILYAKQSVAECGEGGDEPPPVPGYVEPEPQVYERLSWLLKLNKAGLQQRKLVKQGDSLASGFDRFVNLVDFLAVASRKELRNEPLTRDELRTIERYGGHLEMLMLAIAGLVNPGTPNSWWELENKTDRSMALIADVHTSAPNVLEEAVGNAAEVWVVVPIKGKLMLTRGAIFTYYEFTHPMSDRLTDEAWQERLRKHNIPAMPGWTRDFMVPPGVNTPTGPDKMDRSPSGC